MSQHGRRHKEGLEKVDRIRIAGAGTAIMVPKDSPIRTAADLKGRTVAVNRGSIGHALVIAVAEAQGWGVRDIAIANLLPTEAKTALSAGAVDAWWSLHQRYGKLAWRDLFQPGIRYAEDGAPITAPVATALRRTWRRVKLSWNGPCV